MKINYLDLFSGCGGFRKGLEEAGFTFEWEGHSEIDKHAKKVYQTHFPNSEDLGDVRTVDPDNLPKIDLITFGFPCQDLSVAGKQAGLGGSRSGLFFEAMRIVRVARPRYFIFENVKGLFSSNEGRDWLTVLREVADSGYDGQWQLLNTRWFLPQNRERVYFVGHIRGERRPQVFPIGEGNSTYTEEVPTVYCLDANYHKGAAQGARTMIQVGNVDTKGHNSIWGRVYSPEGVATTLNSMGGGMGAKTGLYEVNRTIRSGGRGSTSDKHRWDLIPSGVRRLTPVECARLQGFPDNWHEGLSDTQAYKIYGNAVSVPVVKAVGVRLLEAFNLPLEK